MGFVIWQAKNGETPYRSDFRGPLELSPTELSAVAAGDRRHSARAVLLRVRRASAIAAVLVPRQCEPAVRLNGGRLSAGAHLLAHADRLEFAGRQVWIARDDQVAEVLYQPAVHGDNLFCARTKMRLKPDIDHIVVCPGVGCGLIYKAEAWRLGIPCHGCRFDPRAAGWRPPYHDRGSYDALLKLVQLA